MNKQRLYDIINNKEIHEILYNEKPVWVQKVNDNIATIGFLDDSYIKDVYIEDLYENDLYN